MAASAKDLELRELKDLIKELNKTIKSLNATIEADRKEKARMQEQIDYLTKKLFGTSSERSNSIPGQTSLFDEDEAAAQASEEETIVVKEHTRKKKITAEEKYDKLPKEKVVIPLSDEERTCKVCGTELQKVGEELDHREVIFQPAKMKVIEYYTETWACPKCKQEAEKPVFVKSKAKKPLLPHSPASSSLVSWTEYQKFANGLPFYRQEKDFLQCHAVISRDAMANWTIRCAELYYRPMLNYFHSELLKRMFIMADETRVQVLDEPGKAPETNSYMWVYRSGEDGGKPIVIYRYTPTRAGANAMEFLEGYDGYLEVDGYQGYNKVKGIKRCCCWAHVRRYFRDSVPSGKEDDLSVPGVQAVVYINKLFDIERDCKERGYSFDKIREARQKKARPVIQAFWSWLATLHPDRNTKLDRAVNYALNRKDYLETYLEDGRCSLSNNLSEQAVRPVTVGRKNYLFSQSVSGAEANAAVYSLVETAKANGLNIYGYLKFLLDHRPSEKMTDEELEALAPWNPKVNEAIEAELQQQ